MKIINQYIELTKKLEESLPLKAYPTRELVQFFRKNGHPITLKTALTIISVQSIEDVYGIMCTVSLADDYKLACALTHLIFPKAAPLYSEISDYQKQRTKRINQINSNRIR